MDSQIVASLENEAAQLSASVNSAVSVNSTDLPDKADIVHEQELTPKSSMDNVTQADTYRADNNAQSIKADGSADTDGSTSSSQSVAQSSDNPQTYGVHSDLDVLVDSLQILTDSARSKAGPAQGQYRDKLKDIITPEEITSDVIGSQTDGLNTQLSYNSRFETDTGDDLSERINTAREAGQYIRRIYQICANFRAKDQQNLNHHSSDNPIEGINAIVSGLTRKDSSSYERELTGDLSSSIAKLPELDGSDGSIGNELHKDISSSVGEDNFALEPQKEEMSADELLRKAQEAAKTQIELDKENNQALLAEASELNRSVLSSEIEQDGASVQTGTVSTDDFLNNAYEQMSSQDVETAEDETGDTETADIAFNDQSSLTVSSIEAADDMSCGDTESTDSNHSIKVVMGNLFDDDLPLGQSDVQLKFRMDLSQAVALSTQKKTEFSDETPVIQARYSSLDLQKVVKETLEHDTHTLKSSFEENSHSEAQKDDTAFANRSAVEVLNSTDKQSVVAVVQNTPISKDFAKIDTDSAQKQDVVHLSTEEDHAATDERADELSSYADDADITDDEIESDSHCAVVPQDLSVSQSFVADESSGSFMTDGDPKRLKESTLRLLEEDQQYENRKLGRKLEPKDFYGMVLKHDAWYQDIVKAGYNDGPVYASLCFCSRSIADDPYSWILRVSSDFELLTRSPEFHHNLRTKFSITLGHPVNITLETVKGIPSGSPEDLARVFYLKEIENARNRIVSNPKLRELLEHLGEDVRTLNISLYHQDS
ncbi:MAG: hypothetical protein ACI4UM_01215 [Succinivibrio sp.]